MPLLNYTTTIAAEKTLTEIQRILATHGAQSILLDYDGAGHATAVSFLVQTAHGPRGFRLPANVEAVWRVLTQQHQQGKVPRRFITRDQAARVGWRVIKDWLAAQMALVETEMASLDEIMLPYLTLDSGRTLYQLMSEHQLALPAPGDTSATP